ncbi:MAG TPA: DUF554 family protein [Bacteroidales bacterium]|nr:DUF554 family protein [Bacteroidales bacterium]
MTGTLINTAAIITGSTIGLLLKKQFREELTNILFQDDTLEIW